MSMIILVSIALENDPAEKEIKLQVVVETLRLVVHGFFFGLIILGIILNKNEEKHAAEGREACFNNILLGKIWNNRFQDRN